MDFSNASDFHMMKAIYQKKAMHRDGHIIEEIVVQSNLEDSFDMVVRGEKRKASREGLWLVAHREEFLSRTRKEIEQGHLNMMPLHRAPTPEEQCTNGYHTTTIIEGGKERILQVFCMAARIKVNAVMTVVNRHLHDRYIRTTSASIKRRGMHELKSYIERDLCEHPGEIRYWYKFDVRKFYETVQQDFVMFALRRIFKDAVLLKLMEQLVGFMPTGISMGLPSSQAMGNILLDRYLDHYLKDHLGIRYYYRYCDDGVVGHSSKQYLWYVRDLCHERMNCIGQRIKPNERVFPVTEGLDFLGFVIYPTHTILRKRVKQHFARKLMSARSRKRRRELIGALYGMSKHACCRNLENQLLFPSELKEIERKRLKNKMKKFSEMGLTYRPADGKKRFNGKNYRLSAIANLPIEIYDYEKDIKTRIGGGRTLVSFRFRDSKEPGKFFTDSAEMKDLLQQIDEQDGFPFETTLKSETFGDGKVKYIFT